MIGPNAKAALADVEAALPELREALDWLVANGTTDRALRLVNSLYRYWITKQQFADGGAWYDDALRLRAGDDRLAAGAHIGAGFMAFWLGEDDRATEHWNAALEIGHRLADSAMTSRALGGLARVSLRSDVAEGRRLAAEALAVSEAAGDQPGISNALHLLGVGANIAGDLVEAQAWMTRRLALVRAEGNEAMISSEAANLSMVERQLGNLDRAEALAREALEMAQRRGDEFMKPFSLSGIAAIATDRGEHDRASTLLGAAESIMAAQGAAWPPDERPQYERMLAALPEAMGRERFEERRTAGRALSTDDAVALALSTRHRTSRN